LKSRTERDVRKAVESQLSALNAWHARRQVHGTSMKRLSKIETADDPTDGADDE
jgi:single-strand DNA-binding protein